MHRSLRDRRDRRAATEAFVVLVLACAANACGGGGGRPAASPENEEASAPAGKAWTPPGECVDPLVDGDRRDPTRPFDKRVQLDVRDEDLDGDGVVDTFVKPAWSCGDACRRSAYVVRGTCAHWVGTFGSVDRYETLESRSHGLKDLSTRPRRLEEDGALHCYQVILKFDGTEYQPARKRECECKDDEPKCAAWDE
jgi:hypothetical protein